jgi:UDPglucose--hexose-1-phosphate uridylyltransferase
VVAPARGRRPGIPAGWDLEDAELGACPFCQGHEAETPPETFAIADGAREPNSPGWRVRVFPNLYPALVDPAPPPPRFEGLATGPALGRQEVVVHTPHHAVTVGDLTPSELAGVAAAWRVRAAAARSAGFAYLHALVNEGRAAGASRAHTHSQLVWLPEVPAAVALETRGGSACRVCEMLETERAARDRLVLEADGVVVLAPFASIAPYELIVAPIACEGDAFASDRLEPALAALAESIRRLRAVVPGSPLNAWLHTAALGESAGHWHAHLLPRLTVMAGLELGAGLYVNPLPPEQAAALLRDAGSG